MTHYVIPKYRPLPFPNLLLVDPGSQLLLLSKWCLRPHVWAGIVVLDHLAQLVWHVDDGGRA